MLLGVQRNEPGSKYPFDENSGYVSIFPFSSGRLEAGKIPCDLFSDVIVDCDDGFDIRLSELSASGRIRFSWSFGVGSNVETDTIYVDNRSFYGSDSAMVVLEHAIVRIRSRLGDTLWQIVRDLGCSFPDPGIGFDPSCFRPREKKLESFVVNGTKVSGDVLLRSGYNAGVSIYDQTGAGNAFVIDLSPGAGEGKIPCEDIADNTNFSGLRPGSDGSARIESEDCYSIIPISTDVLQITGNCSACCTCEGDYLPVAIAVTNLIKRVHDKYDKLRELIANYNEYIEAAESVMPEPGSLDLKISARWYPGLDSTNIHVNVAAINSLNAAHVELLELKLLFYCTGVDSPHQIDFSSAPASSAGVNEYKRSIRINNSSILQAQAVIPQAGLYFPVGGIMTANSDIYADNSSSGGIAVSNSSSIVVKVKVRITGTDSTVRTVAKSAKIIRTN